MSLLVVPQPNITTGDPSNRLSFTATIGFSGTAPTLPPDVKAAIVSNDLSLTIINPVAVVVSSFTVAGNVATISGNIAFSDVETRNFLTVPLDLSSPLIKAVTRGSTDYATALLEIQIGSPFFETWHGIVTIGKGLIP